MTFPFIKRRDLLLSLVTTDKDFLKTPGLPFGLYSAIINPSLPGFISFFDQLGVVHPQDGLTDKIFIGFPPVLVKMNLKIFAKCILK